MPRVVVDFDRCEGHGLCEEAAPEVFQLDDEGSLHVLREVVGEELEAAVQTAARLCPVVALKLEP